MTGGQNRWRYRTPARAHTCSRHRFRSIDLLSLELREPGGIHLLLSSRTARLIKARPTQAVTSHQPISKSWWGSRQATGTPAGAAGPVEARPGRRRRGCSMTVSARRPAPAAQPRLAACYQNRWRYWTPASAHTCLCHGFHCQCIHLFQLSLELCGQNIFAPFFSNSPAHQSQACPSCDSGKTQSWSQSKQATYALTSRSKYWMIWIKQQMVYLDSSSACYKMQYCAHAGTHTFCHQMRSGPSRRLCNSYSPER